MMTNLQQMIQDSFEELTEKNKLTISLNWENTGKWTCDFEGKVVSLHDKSYLTMRENLFGNEPFDDAADKTLIDIFLAHIISFHLVDDYNDRQVKLDQLEEELDHHIFMADEEGFRECEQTYRAFFLDTQHNLWDAAEQILCLDTAEKVKRFTTTKNKCLQSFDSYLAEQSANALDVLKAKFERLKPLKRQVLKN